MRSIPDTEQLRAILAKIDKAVPPDVARSLNPGACNEDLALLEKSVVSGRPLPSDLATLLQWHNGQEWNSLLSPENNRRLLTVPEIIEHWSFFKDPMSDFLEPWRESWIPILTNQWC
jgi:cell wall assembly regulator SMI1